MRFDVATTCPQFNAALGAFIRHQKTDVASALRLQGRLLAQKLVEFTPPKTKKQGEEAVKRDIKRVFFGYELADAARVQNLNGTRVVRLFSRKDGTVYGVDEQRFLKHPTMAQMDQHHQGYRDSRGRVSKAGTYGNKEVGRWKFLQTLVVPATSLDAFIQRVQGRVGRAKGGWAATVRGLGGSVAKWIGRHIGIGTVVDNTASANPHIILRNHSEWAGNANERQRVLQNAMTSRAQAILKSIEVAQAKALEKARRK